MDEGYDFIWRRGQKPILVTPGGRRVVLEVENFCPVLPVGYGGEDHSVQARNDAKEKAPAAQSNLCESSRETVKPAVADLDTVKIATSEKKKVPVDVRSLRIKHTEPLPSEHSLTHMPKDSRCDICMKCRTMRKQCRRKSKKSEGELMHKTPEKFGDIITADHILGVVGMAGICKRCNVALRTLVPNTTT